MIKLNEKYAITADGNQYIVGTPVERLDKQGNIAQSMSNARYFPRLSTALKSTVERILRDGVADGSIGSLQKYVERMHELTHRLSDVSSRFDGELAIREEE